MFASFSTTRVTYDGWGSVILILHPFRIGCEVRADGSIWEIAYHGATPADYASHIDHHEKLTQIRAGATLIEHSNEGILDLRRTGPVRAG